MKSDLPVWQEDAVAVPFGTATYFDVTCIQAGIIVRRRKDKYPVIVMSDDEAVDLAKIILQAYEGDANGRFIRSDSPRHGMDRDSV